MPKEVSINYQFEKGRVKRTSNQVKKHVSQMSENEILILNTLVNNINPNEVNISNHAKNHIPMLNKSIIRQTLESYSIIEFNMTHGRPRVLIRSNKYLNVMTRYGMDKANVCLVLSIDDMTLVTGYANMCSDTHSSLDMSRYDGDMDIVRFAIGNN